MDLEYVSGPRGNSRSKEGINKMRYVENASGESITGERAKQMRDLARRLWQQLLDGGIARATWSRVPHDGKVYYETTMAQHYPELQLCEDNWKAKQICTDNYPSWIDVRREELPVEHRKPKKRTREVKQEMQEDPDTSDSRKKSKKASQATMQAPALPLVSGSSTIPAPPVSLPRPQPPRPRIVSGTPASNNVGAASNEGTPFVTESGAAASSSSVSSMTVASPLAVPKIATSNEATASNAGVPSTGKSNAEESIDGVSKTVSVPSKLGSNEPSSPLPRRVSPSAAEVTNSFESTIVTTSNAAQPRPATIEESAASTDTCPTPATLRVDTTSGAATKPPVPNFNPLAGLTFQTSLPSPTETEGPAPAQDVPNMANNGATVNTMDQSSRRDADSGTPKGTDVDLNGVAGLPNAFENRDELAISTTRHAVKTKSAQGPMRVQSKPIAANFCSLVWKAAHPSAPRKEFVDYWDALPSSEREKYERVEEAAKTKAMLKIPNVPMLDILSKLGLPSDFL